MRICVGVASCLGRLDFGLTADFDAVPDAGLLREGIRAGPDEPAQRAAVPAPGQAIDEVGGAVPRCPDSPPRVAGGPD